MTKLQWHRFKLAWMNMRIEFKGPMSRNNRNAVQNAVFVAISVQTTDTDMKWWNETDKAGIVYW